MSIKSELKSVINTISDFSKQTNLIAINTAILASRTQSSQTAGFKVLADEVQQLSSLSIEKLGQINNLVDSIATLTILINLSGRQRMLLMKMVNAHFTENYPLISETKKHFETSLNQIKKSPINDKKCKAIIKVIEDKWVDFIAILESQKSSSIDENSDAIINLLNELISEYEKYGGN